MCGAVTNEKGLHTTPVTGTHCPFTRIVFHRVGWWCCCSSASAPALMSLLLLLLWWCCRVLIYSQFTRTLDILEDWVAGRGWGYERIDGGSVGRSVGWVVGWVGGWVVGWVGG